MFHAEPFAGLHSSLVLPLALGMIVTGCVGTRVEYYADHDYPARDHHEPIAWLSEPPEQPYLELARITVSSTQAGETRLRQSLLDRARLLGADAVIADVPFVIKSAGPTPFYEPGLFGPMGAAFGMYGYGWYAPYSSNPYILIQGAVDQPRIERDVSGIAIRYESEDHAGQTP